jgi:hypothetical protein
VRNDPLNSADPLGMTALVYYDDAGNVEIDLQVLFTGPAATPENVATVTQNIEQAWTGQFGQYNVTTTVVPVSEMGPTVNRITIVPGATSSDTGHSVTTSNWDMELSMADVNGQSIGNTIADAGHGTAEHEAGHLMGERDLYNPQQTPVREPWMQGTMMDRGGSGQVAEQNITSIINNTSVNEVRHCPTGTRTCR